MIDTHLIRRAIPIAWTVYVAVLVMLSYLLGFVQGRQHQRTAPTQQVWWEKL